MKSSFLYLQLYTKYKDDPPMARNMPPISGKIMWIRQLAERIQEPMMIFAVRFSIIADLLYALLFIKEYSLSINVKTPLKC